MAADVREGFATNVTEPIKHFFQSGWTWAVILALMIGMVYYFWPASDTPMMAPNTPAIANGAGIDAVKQRQALDMGVQLKFEDRFLEINKSFTTQQSSLAALQAGLDKTSAQLKQQQTPLPDSYYIELCEAIAHKKCDNLKFSK